MALEKKTIKCQLSGLSDIMFDRFIDHSKEVRPPEQKLYLVDDNQVVLPSENIISFICGEKPAGCAKTFEGKKGKDYMRTALGHIFIDPIVIPFFHKEKPVVFKNFDKGPLWLYWASGVTKSGSSIIKQEAKARPVLRLPWTLDFTITLIDNPLIDPTKLYNWFVKGGILVSIGTYRPRFGRFEVSKWDEIE